MKSVVHLAILCLGLAKSVKASEVLRPRGVPLSKTSFYDPSRDFRCLDGSGTIPFNYVNDDYCDCQDGSDEPGTAACPNGQFHCTNAGHSPLNIPSSRVNDGICDCCDASDEYASSASCTNTCREMGRAAREESLRQQQAQMQGYQLRQSMIQEGKKRNEEDQAKITELKKEKELADAVLSEKEEMKKVAEEPEKEALEKYRVVEEEKRVRDEAEKKERESVEAREAFAHLDNNGDGVITIAEIQSRQTFDTNRDGEVSEEEAKFYFRQEEQMDLDTFITSGWAMMRPTYMMDKGMFTPPTTFAPPTPEDLTAPPPLEDPEVSRYVNSRANWELLSEEPEDLEEDYDFPDDSNEEDPAKEEEPAEEEVKYDEETQRLVDAANVAREAFNEADRHVRDLVRELKNLEEKQEKDLGPEEEFRVMEGECYEFTDREYTYKLCPFDKTVQKPKNGAGETRLGQWGEWTGSEDKYSSMKYSNGQACWNGPSRSTDVNLVCGIENQLLSVTEPNRCEYLMVLQTPAVCAKSEANDSHDEL
ncbi:unnamed protein product [Meganyctiphanes norvegica]|uniref:Glucosidase 2 subunit beta n=1 Tax=Meganyctiphanes norvegica TaxID=48144 RepID=A0AAV2R282_MEGNR